MRTGFSLVFLGLVAIGMAACGSDRVGVEPEVADLSMPDDASPETLPDLRKSPADLADPCGADPSCAQPNRVCNASTHSCDCAAGFNSCGGSCVADGPGSCGASCTACPAPAQATATCSAGSCGFTCPALRCGEACCTALSVTTGGWHTCALTSEHGVKCWGENTHGELGDNSGMHQKTPRDVVGLTSGVQMVKAGSDQTCALLDTGGVKCWGDNFEGQLGDGTYSNRSTPVDVSGLTSGVASIAAGGDVTGFGVSCAVTTLGAAKCWGYNNLGQLGDGGQVKRATAMNVSGLTSGVTAISVGGRHVCALVGDAAKCWGYNHYRVLGNGSNTDSALPVAVTGLDSGVSSISAGGFSTCAMHSGVVKCWGDNDIGELGTGNGAYSATPVIMPGSSSLVSVVVGTDHVCGRTTTGGLKCWADNNRGQLGDGTVSARFDPVDVTGLTSGVANSASAHAGGEVHTCAVTAAGGVLCWGDNAYGQLGDGTNVERHTPVAVVGY